MEYRDYTLDILISGSLVEIGPSEFSFSMSDDIFSFFPKVNFQIKDVAGVLMELLAFTPGEKLEISFGLLDQLIQNKYICRHFENEDIFTQGVLNGLLSVSGIHEFASLQTRESFSYSGTPSDITEELVSTFPFSQLKIDSSENNHIWYRPFYTQKELIEHVFLENVYSDDSNDTPFFAFIDNDNVFHFESFFTMMERTPTEELLYTPRSYGEDRYNRIIDFKPLSEDYLTLYRNLTNRFFRRNDTSFDFLEEDKHITEVYPGDYLVSQEEVILSDYKYFGRTDQDKYENDILGQQLFKQRQSLLTNKALVLLPLNVNLTAGKTVEILMASSLGQEESSITYSGKFLVEKSTHTWNGDAQNGFSQLLLSRKNKKLPDDYLLKERLYNP